MTDSVSPDPAQSSIAPTAIAADENKLMAERREKLHGLRKHGNAYPNDFRIDAFAGFVENNTVLAHGLAQGGKHGIGMQIVRVDVFRALPGQ